MIDVNFQDDGNLRDWIAEQAQEHSLQYLLAYGDDGVIWGKFQNGQLVTSGDVFPELTQLRLITLQRCHIFGKTGQALLWRAAGKWRTSYLEDGKQELIKESQMLWGTDGEEKDGFTLVTDGSEGLRHAVPLCDIQFKPKELYRPLRLVIHHYVEYDEVGLARIGSSRLVDLKYISQG
jgi:CRISPR-associated protein (TIGR03984 family)